MITQERLRKDFEPITVACTIRVETQTSSPITQVYTGNDGTYNPDRGILPLILFPATVSGCSDGSWQSGQCNSKLASMVWYVGDKDITTLSDWAGKYSIDNSSDNSKRGAITITKNIAPKERAELHFEAVIADIRFGMNVVVKSNAVVLSTIDRAEDDWSLMIDEDEVICYNPFDDKLLEYEYKVAQGMISASDSLRNAALDKSAYERHIAIGVTQGSTSKTSGYALKLYRVDTSGNVTEISADTDEEIISLSLTELVLDLRLIEKGDYRLSLLVDGSEKKRRQFSVGRRYPPYTVHIVSAESILPSDVSIRNKVIVTENESTVECPDPMMDLTWITDTASLTGISHNNGSTTVIPLDRTGIGDTYDTDWVDVKVDSMQCPALSVLTDGDGNDLEDENGNLIIG